MEKYVFLITYTATFEDGETIKGQVTYPSDTENLRVSEFKEWKKLLTEHLEKRKGKKLSGPPMLENCTRLIDDR